MPVQKQTRAGQRTRFKVPATPSATCQFATSCNRSQAFTAFGNHLFLRLRFLVLRLRDVCGNDQRKGLAAWCRSTPEQLSLSIIQQMTEARYSTAPLASFVSLVFQIICSGPGNHHRCRPHCGCRTARASGRMQVEVHMQEDHANRGFGNTAYSEARPEAACSSFRDQLLLCGQAFVVVGDSNGHVGLGVKCAKEVATAIRGAIILAKTSVVPVRRGYWGNKIGKPHTVPTKATGKCGSVTVRFPRLPGAQLSSHLLAEPCLLGILGLPAGSLYLCNCCRYHHTPTLALRQAAMSGNTRSHRVACRKLSVCLRLIGCLCAAGAADSGTPWCWHCGGARAEEGAADGGHRGLLHCLPRLHQDLGQLCQGALTFWTYFKPDLAQHSWLLRLAVRLAGPHCRLTASNDLCYRLARYS